MSHPAPSLTREGFLRGCSQPGAPKKMKQTVSIGDIDITFTSSGVILSTDNPQRMRELSDAKGAVGNHDTRLTRRNS